MSHKCVRPDQDDFILSTVVGSVGQRALVLWNINRSLADNHQVLIDENTRSLGRPIVLLNHMADNEISLSNSRVQLFPEFTHPTGRLEGRPWPINYTGMGFPASRRERN